MRNKYYVARCFGCGWGLTLENQKAMLHEMTAHSWNCPTGGPIVALPFAPGHVPLKDGELRVSHSEVKATPIM